METKFYKLTENKKIFKVTYWGTFTLEDRTEEDIKEINKIVENRNNFLKEYSIKRISPLPSKLKDEFEKTSPYLLDHVEIYKTEDNKYVIVNSPYTDNTCQKYNELLSLGWKVIDKLYFNNATTFVKILNPDDFILTKKEKAHNSYKDHDKTPILCECGETYSYSHKSRHMKSKHHMAITNIIKRYI